MLNVTRLVAIIVLSLAMTSMSLYGQSDNFCLVDNFTLGTSHGDQNTIPLYRTTEQLNIRTVVHVVYSQPDDNVADSTVQWLIEQVNLHFAAAERDTSLVHPDHRPGITNTEIQFCLASVDPGGNPTSGITHTETEIPFFSTPNAADSILIENVKQDSLGGKSAWSPNSYFNIWVAPMSNAMSSANYGLPYPNFFPLDVHGIFGQGVPGAVLDVYNLTSSGVVPAQKVLTHEVGHVMGLFHVWGFPSSCDVDDYIEDTPVCSVLSGNCPGNQNTCADSTETRVDNISNIMAYSCMEMFTAQQVDVMRTNVLNLAPGILLDDDEDCDPTTSINDPQYSEGSVLKIYPNPSYGVFTIDYEQPRAGDIVVRIFGPDGKIARNWQYESSTDFVKHIDLSGFAAGIYTLVILGQETTTTERLILIR